MRASGDFGAAKSESRSDAELQGTMHKRHCSKLKEAAAVSAHLESDIEPLVAAGQAQCPEKHRQGNNEKKGLHNFDSPVCPAAGMHAASTQGPKGSI